MDSEDSSEKLIQASITGINNVRNPSLEFLKVKETQDYIDFLVMTHKSKEKKEIEDEIKGCSQPYSNYMKSFVFCNDSMRLKMPKPSFMVTKQGKKKFAYAVGMFPNPKTGKASYLDGCILAALGLKRQNTMADVICFITHDISQKDKEKLEVVFDKVIYVPYISPYDMGGKGDLQTIMMDPAIFKNCPNYTKNHPYVHVFFKLHIFNPKLFPYEKVCFVDSDLVPLNFYDSLFLIDCPAGFVEYRKKIPYLEAFHWDRCDFLEHGKPIPKPLTDIDKKTGADVNAGLLLVKPDEKEYNEMIREITSPVSQWMGPDKVHKGFHNFNFDKPSGQEFVADSYCYPEQNYLTKRYSGNWNYIEFAFQSWALDPCNSFGIHMAAFNPKPWFKQPIAGKLRINETYNPYIKKRSKKNVRIPVTIKENSNQNYDNISFSYEIFNELIIWGLHTYEKLCDFFVHGTQIHGTKVSFDRDVFEKISPDSKQQFKRLKDIKKSSKTYLQLSLTQRYISDLLNKDKETRKLLNKGYLQICRSGRLERKGNKHHNFKILDYPNHKVRVNIKQSGGGNNQTKLVFYTMEGCPYCVKFHPEWMALKQNKDYTFEEYERSKDLDKILKQNIQSFPTLFINGKQYEGEMKEKDIVEYVKKQQKKKRTKKKKR